MHLLNSALGKWYLFILICVLLYRVLRPLQFLSGYPVREFLLTHILHGLLGHILECVSVLLCLGILTRGSLYGFSQAKCALSLLIHEASIFLGICCELVIIQEPEWS